MPNNEIRITLETLFELLRTEKKRGELQPLPLGFLEDVANYIAHKRTMATQNSSELTKGQLEQIYSILRDLFSVRERKLLELARLRAGSERQLIIDGMLETEQQFYRQMVKLIRGFRAALKQRAMESGTTAPQTNGNCRVEILAPIPRFVGEGMRVFGPFNQGDVVELPEAVAQILSRRGKARLMETK